jgi:CO dehydrogenase/acetyl-CoA synthase delta subunit
MDYKAPVEAYTGVVREVTIGKGNRSLKIGGENTHPLHFFDQGSNPKSGEVCPGSA